MINHFIWKKEIYALIMNYLWCNLEYSYFILCLLGLETINNKILRLKKSIFYQSET